MAAHDDDVGGTGRGANQRDMLIGTSVKTAAERIDRHEPVRLGERRHRTRALAYWKRNQSLLARHKRHQDESLAAYLRSDADRYGRCHGLRGFRLQPSTPADDRRHEGMEGEDRGGRESGQHRDRLAVYRREAQRLARLEGDAVNQNSWRSEP